MSEFTARISRVRLKNGGADVRVLHRNPGPDGGDDWRGALVRNARAVAEMGTSERPLAGYVLLGIFDDGTTSVGYRYNSDSKCAIPRALLPAFVAEIIRRDLISGEEARDVFDEMFQWVD